MLTNSMDMKFKVRTNPNITDIVLLYIDGASVRDLDFDDAVTQELKELKEKPVHRRFQSVESGAKNVVFIQCEAPVCPDHLVHSMLTSIKASGMPCTRYNMLVSVHCCNVCCFDYIGIASVYCLLLTYAEPFRMTSENVLVKC